VVQVLLKRNELKLARGLPELGALVRELTDMRSTQRAGAECVWARTDAVGMTTWSSLWHWPAGGQGRARLDPVRGGCREWERVNASQLN
jgi:hypothetical protein